MISLGNKGEPGITLIGEKGSEGRQGEKGEKGNYYVNKYSTYIFFLNIIIVYLQV